MTVCPLKDNLASPCEDVAVLRLLLHRAVAARCRDRPVMWREWLSGKVRVIATCGLHQCDVCSGSELQPGALGDSHPLGLTPIGEMTPVPTTVYMERVLRPGRIVPHT